MGKPKLGALFTTCYIFSSFFIDRISIDKFIPTNVSSIGPVRLSTGKSDKKGWWCRNQVVHFSFWHKQNSKGNSSRVNLIHHFSLLFIIHQKQGVLPPINK